MKENAKLISFSVRVDGHKALVTAKYEVERNDGIHIIAFDDVPLRLSDLPAVITGFDYMSIDFGFGEIICDNCPGILYTDRLVKPRIKEMTMEDIEKELGYSIKIVKEHKK